MHFISYERLIQKTDERPQKTLIEPFLLSCCFSTGSTLYITFRRIFLNCTKNVNLIQIPQDEWIS